MPDRTLGLGAVTARLAFTCGDPAGVGPEIIRGWLEQNPTAAGEIAVLGPPRWLETIHPAAEKIAVGLASFADMPGRPTGEGALVAWAAMERAANGCRTGEFSGVVTGPVSKAQLAGIGYPYPGQTEFFAARWGGEPVMAFCGGKLRVVLATWHVPLAQVSGLLGLQLLRRTVAAADDLARVFRPAPPTLASPTPAPALTAAAVGGPAEPTVGGSEPGAGGSPAAATTGGPRIGVCGLNPHAGEGGLMGREELEIIDPALDELRIQFPGLSSCQPGDTLFARQLRGEFDVVVALYHDQGLAPLKVIDFDEAVNVTLGLPHVRTSPDHGTAFGIAGQGTARLTSFGNAVAVARQLIAARRLGGGVERT